MTEMGCTAGIELLSAVAALAIAAGRRIEALRAAGVIARAKPDGSPVTEADQTAEAVLLAGLAALCPGVPVVSEESEPALAAPVGGCFFLVDPLDGTREFLAGNGQYTVNVALISQGVPRLGVIHAPASGDSWLGLVGAGAWRIAQTQDGMPPSAAWQPIRCRRRPPRPTVVVSRSHLDPATAAAVAALGPATCLPMGSSLKFAWLADGRADHYFRLGRTHEWDIAAGHAVLVAAGGAVAAPGGAALHYGRGDAGFVVDGFCAVADSPSGFSCPPRRTA